MNLPYALLRAGLTAAASWCLFLIGRESGWRGLLLAVGYATFLFAAFITHKRSTP